MLSEIEPAIGAISTVFSVAVALFATWIFFRECDRWGDLKKAMAMFTLSSIFFMLTGVVFAIVYGLNQHGSAFSIASNVFYAFGLLTLFLGAREIAKYSALFRPLPGDKKRRK